MFIQDTDLIVLDFAVNDGHVSPTWRDKDGYSFTSGARMGFEQLASGGMAACAEGGLRMSSEEGGCGAAAGLLFRGAYRSLAGWG